MRWQTKEKKWSPGAHPRSRSGFTVVETVAALSLLAVAMLLVTQVAVWSLGEQTRCRNQQVAEELAANVLESARATPWEDLTGDWAAAQRLPEPYEKRQWRLKVRVEPEPARAQTKRLIVEIRFLPEGSKSARPVQLIGLFCARSATLGGGKP